jgi:hypothetical protein
MFLCIQFCLQFSFFGWRANTQKNCCEKNVIKKGSGLQKQRKTAREKAPGSFPQKPINYLQNQKNESTGSFRPKTASDRCRNFSSFLLHSV